MSVNYHIKKEGISNSLKIPGTQISSQELHALLAEKLGLSKADIIITNPITGLRFSQIEMIKDRYSVNVEKVQSVTPPLTDGILSNQDLAEMVAKARFFMIKSSNEENIQKARDQSVWATTLSNQEKLRSAFLYHPHVFMFFATNRSYELKGLARMETQPAKNPDKSCWSGVSNIRLGGNFRIKWIRKTPLTALQIEKVLGSVTKDRIMRMSDGEQMDAEICKKIALMFELPTAPYYEPKQQVVEKKNIQKKIPNLAEIIGREMPVQQFNYPIPPSFFVPPPMIGSVEKESQGKKQLERNRSKHKSKKRKRSYSSSESSSSDSSSSSSESSSRSRSKLKRRKHKKEHGRKKERKRRHRQRSSSMSSISRREKKKKKKSGRSKDRRRKKQRKS